MLRIDISKLPPAIVRLNAEKFASLAVPRTKRENVHAGRETRKGKRIPLTERFFYNSELAPFGRFETLHEAVTFRLDGGSRYTPDFFYCGPNGRFIAIEVKGVYKLHSHGRALTAFREAAAKYPQITFAWYEVDTRNRRYHLKHSFNFN